LRLKFFISHPASRIPHLASRIPHPMPTYVYQEILPDGSDGEAFEYIQRMVDASLKTHPKTGNPVRKVFHSPNVSSKYTEGATKNKLTDANVEKHGFTRYERDKVTGRYNKTAGKDKRAPDVVDANQLKEIQKHGLV
jgi:predicted nucleic acid-binding Zn ribbon protein